MTGWLTAQGIIVPAPGDLTQAGVALALVLASLGIGWIAGARIGPALAELWKRQIGDQAEGLGARLAKITRHGIAAILLGIVSMAWPWSPVAALGIGVALGAAAALVSVQIARGVNLPRWMAWTLALLIFVALLSQSVGGLTPVTGALARIGLDIGARRLSLLSLVTGFTTIVVLYAIVRVVNRGIVQALRGSRTLDPTQRLLAQKLAGIALLVVAFFFGIDLLGIDLTTFAVFSGAFGLAVGFGMQKTIGNLIAGIILLMDRSIKPGDVIAVGESFGWVNKIGVRAVSVITREGKEHLIPNELLMTQEVENWSYSNRNVRVAINITVGYDCDIEQAQALMLRAAVESPRVLDTPDPVVWLVAMGDNGLEHEIRLWISDPEAGIGNIKGDVLKRLWLLFKEHGVTVPFPQREVRIVPTPVGGAPLSP